MERSFSKEIESLRLGAGEVFEGEGILAVTKALLQSGVSYVGGYPGSPVSHLLDVMVQARDYLDELGVHVEACGNEASAAAMLAASIMYPVRGAVTWKSIVGTNVASDALANLSSPGVMGGALIVVGEDYGEGASVVQERGQAFAMKSAVWLMDPRPDLPTMVRMVEHGFRMSEASNTVVMMDLRIRACHLNGSFIASDNVAPKISSRALASQPAGFDYSRLAHPPATFAHEKLKYTARMPAAQAYIESAELNEIIAGSDEAYRGIGLIVQGGLTNSLLRAMALAGLADFEGNSRIDILVLNVVYPLVPDQLVRFCADRQAVLMIEEGQPAFIESELGALLHRQGIKAALHGKDFLPMGGEYTVDVLREGVVGFVADVCSPAGLDEARAAIDDVRALVRKAGESLGTMVPPRPPGFCIGCPERPVFSAMKLVERELGRFHVSTDIGCHSFATFPPFSFGNSILGYGMSLASSAAVNSFMLPRTVAVMGDGGFWHNGLLSGVGSSLFNRGDGVLILLKNGYTAATGTQELVSTPTTGMRRIAEGASATSSDMTIENTLRGLGVKWMTTVHNYQVDKVRSALRDALTAPERGLKVIIAEGECQLERQRRLKPIMAERLRQNLRVVRTRYGVDEDTCTGDHSCIRLSGCPTLTVAPSSDPLKTEPVAKVIDGCVGCGLCGEVADAAVLCPSFYRVDVVSNAGWFERLSDRLRRAVILMMTSKKVAA